MPATPQQWVTAIQSAMGSLQGALAIAEALAYNKVTFVGLDPTDTRYQESPSNAQINAAAQDMYALINDAFNVIRDTKNL